ncbi:MAG: hypothetical protein V4568_09565 [Pseudomonadota bacterium]
MAVETVGEEEPVLVLEEQKKSYEKPAVKSLDANVETEAFTTIIFS